MAPCTHPQGARKLFLSGFQREFCTDCNEFVLLPGETELPQALRKRQTVASEKPSRYRLLRLMFAKGVQL